MPYAQTFSVKTQHNINRIIVMKNYLKMYTVRYIYVLIYALNCIIYNFIYIKLVQRTTVNHFARQL